MDKLFGVLTSLLLSLLSTPSYSDICPLPSQFNPRIPPGGWSLLMPAVFVGDNYQFVSATHSLNPTYYNLQVICRYECLPDSRECSPFTLLSNATYKHPATNKWPWNVPPLLIYTMICSPPDNNPLDCVFSNIPNNDGIALNEFKREWRTFPESLYLV